MSHNKQSTQANYRAHGITQLIFVSFEGHDLPIHACIKHNKLNCLKVLVENGASVDEQDGLGKTPLHVAVLEYFHNYIKTRSTRDEICWAICFGKKGAISKYASI